MTTEQLKKERNDHLAEIAMIQGQINTQITKGPVNELYGRINFLTDRIREIDNELCQQGDTKEASSNSQIEKGISVAGGNVIIRPNESISEDPDPLNTKVRLPDHDNPRVIAAKDNSSKIQKNSKP